MHYMTKTDKLTKRQYTISLVDPRIVFRKEKLLKLPYSEQDRIVKQEKMKFNEKDNFLESHDNQIFEAYETEYVKIVRSIRF